MIEFLNKYIPVQQEPRLWLPIMGVVIAYIFLNKSMWFDKSALLHQEIQLLQKKLIQANVSITILGILVLLLSGFSYVSLYLLYSQHVLDCRIKFANTASFAV